MSKKLKQGQERVGKIKGDNVLKEMFGGHKFKKSVDKLMKETDKAFK